MLKLIKSEIPSWVINWTNKEFKTSMQIWWIVSIIVDWNQTTNFSYFWIQINLQVAPTSSIVISYLAKEIKAIDWTWEVTLWKMINSFYSKIWRVNPDWTIPENIQKLYPTSQVKDELRKSTKRITNKSPERNLLQQYSIKTSWWAKIIWTNSENVITLEQSLENEIQWMFMITWWTIYDYYWIDWNKFQVNDVDISKIGDRIIFWNRIPYWVQKISSITINWIPIDFIDEREFDMFGDYYTIITNPQWGRFIFFPYMGKEIIAVIKFIPDLNWIYDDEDVINIPEEYSDVIVYDCAYRMLLSKEDDRWNTLKQELWDWTIRTQWLLYEYQMFIKSNIKSTKNKIWFAKT